EEELHSNAAWISLNKSLAELGQNRLEQGLVGAAHALESIAPLFVMSDPQDIHVVPQVKADHNEKPTIFFYDRYPGGIGLSEKIFTEMDSVLLDAKKMIERCHCEHGCPSCIGAEAISDTAKKDTLKIIDSLLKNEKGLRV
ncbi:MAG: DUF1998 domain-containing protein, partial [Bacillota bacterium]|nr:DUF1998 domain-containing protein [Bacillota bacterium]